MNSFEIYNYIFLILNKVRSNFGYILKYSMIIFNNSLCNKYPILKLLFGIFLINFIYRTFIYFLFFLIKSIFPIIYVYFMLYFMDKNSENKPFSNLIKKIRNDNINKNNNFIDSIEKEFNKKLGINDDFLEEV